MTTATAYPLNVGALQTYAEAHGTYPLKVLLANGFVFNDAHQYADDVSGELSGGSYARVTLENVAWTVVDDEASITADDPVFAAFTGTFDTAVFFADMGADSVSPLISHVTLPPTTSTAEAQTLDLSGGKIVTYNSLAPVLSVAGVEPGTSGDVPVDELYTALEPYLTPETGSIYTATTLVGDADLSGGSFTTLDIVDPVTGTATTAGVPRASLVGAIAAVLDGDDGGKLYTVTSSGPCTLVAACAAGDLVVILANRYVVQASNADGFGGVAAAGAADRFSLHIPYEGAGLDSDINDVHAGLRNHEGTLDRWTFVVAIAESNVNLAALGSATWTYGGLDYTGSAPHCHVWLRGQTTTSQNGFYEVGPSPSYTATKINHPDIFDPPGQGYRVTLKSGDSDDGKTWVWLNDKPDDRMRVNGETDLAETGRWVEWIGFAAGGSGDVATDTIWNAAGDLAIGTGADTATRLAIGTSGQLLKSNGTTAAWATITASDVGAAATSHSHAASDITSGTLDIARIPTGTTSSHVAIGNDSRFTQVVGGQDEGTTATSSSATSLLDSTINLAGLAAGDSIDIAASMRHLNNSGSSRSHTITLKIGSTTVATMTTPSMATSASYRFAVLRATIRVEAASDQNTMATHTITSLTTAADGSASTENLSSGAALDITGAVGAGGSQEIQLLQLTVTRNRA